VYPDDFSVVRQSKEFFLVPKFILDVLDEVPESPVRKGFFLGFFDSQKFIPSPFLLNIINSFSKKFVVLNEKSSWLFICGRDIFEEGVLKLGSSENGLFIALNDRQEILGLCKKTGKSFTNLFDIGFFQRLKR
jgi:hypothetical protein